MAGRHPKLLAAALLLFGAIYAFGYLKLGSRWWFEDDPALYAYSNEIHNPVSVFIDPGILRHLISGQTLVPIQVLSFWIDDRLAGFSPRFAYAHHVASFLVTLLLIYLILLRAFDEDAIAAFVVSVLWVLLPSTAVVLQFVSTRHYLEGMMFSALALYLLQRSHNYAALVSMVVGMLCKEIYVAVMPAIMLLYAWRRRDRQLALSTVVIVCVYGLYRYWMLGPALSYGMPLLSVGQYLKFLSKLPYTMSSNYGGYCLYGAILALAVYFARQRREHVRPVLYFLAVLTLELGAIFPVCFPLYGTIRSPDPWYRILIVFNTVAIIFGGYLAIRCLTRRMQLGLAVAAIVILMPGAEKTRRLWDEMTASAEREGKFYLSNPNKMLLSEQVAWWFIPGVNWMYQVKTPHYVLIKDLASFQREPGQQLWRYKNGEFVPDLAP